MRSSGTVAAASSATMLQGRLRQRDGARDIVCASASFHRMFAECRQQRGVDMQHSHGSWRRILQLELCQLLNLFAC